MFVLRSSFWIRNVLSLDRLHLGSFELDSSFESVHGFDGAVVFDLGGHVNADGSEVAGVNGETVGDGGDFHVGFKGFHVTGL